MAQRFRKRKECLCRMLITTASASTLKWNVRDCYTSELSSSPAGPAQVMQQEHAARRWLTDGHTTRIIDVGSNQRPSRLT